MMSSPFNSSYRETPLVLFQSHQKVETLKCQNATYQHLALRAQLAGASTNGNIPSYDYSAKHAG